MTCFVLTCTFVVFCLVVLKFEMGARLFVPTLFTFAPLLFSSTSLLISLVEDIDHEAGWWLNLGYFVLQFSCVISAVGCWFLGLARLFWTRNDAEQDYEWLGYSVSFAILSFILALAYYAIAFVVVIMTTA